MSGPPPRRPTSPTPAALEALARRLEAEPRVALDTESNSFHAYRERVCLMQISIPGADFIVDPIAVDVRPAGRRAGRRAGARPPRRRLRRALPAARVRLGPGADLRHHDRGAAAGLEGAGAGGAGPGPLRRPAHQGAPARRLGAAAAHRRDQLRYAALDTHFLLPLHDILSAGLRPGRRRPTRPGGSSTASPRPRPTPGSSTRRAGAS